MPKLFYDLEPGLGGLAGDGEGDMYRLAQRGTLAHSLYLVARRFTKPLSATVLSI